VPCPRFVDGRQWEQIVGGDHPPAFDGHDVVRETGLVSLALIPLYAKRRQELGQVPVGFENLNLKQARAHDCQVRVIFVTRNHRLRRSELEHELVYQIRISQTRLSLGNHAFLPHVVLVSHDPQSLIVVPAHLHHRSFEVSKDAQKILDEL